MDVGTQGLEPCPAAFPGTKQGAGLEMKQMGYELVPIWDKGAAGENLVCCTTVPAPEVVNIFLKDVRICLKGKMSARGGKQSDRDLQTTGSF